jgi:Domain of unknown function (DUF4397)
VRNDLKLFATCIAAVAVLGACGGGSLANGGDVRLVNATTAFPKLDLYDGSTKISSGVASNTAGGYVEVDKDSHTFNVADTTTGVTAATVNGNVSRDDHFTVVAYTAGGTLTAAYLSDDEGSPSSGTAKLRFFNTATTDVASVDAYLVAAACSTLATSFSAPVATGVSGLQTTYTQVNPTLAGTSYHICITAAGDKTDLRLDIPGVTLADQQIVTVILAPTPGGVLLNGLLLNQQGSLTATPSTSARIRLAVGATASAAVTASVNGVALGTGLIAPAVGNYKLVPAGPLTIDMTVNGVTASNVAGLTATSGADLTLLVTGTAASAPVLIADDNSASTSTTNPVKLRLVNGMNGLGTAVLTDDFDNIGDGAAFGTATAYAQVPASSALARLEATSGVTLCLSSLVTLNANSVYTVFLLGDVPPAATTCTLRLDR